MRQGYTGTSAVIVVNRLHARVASIRSTVCCEALVVRS
jgi:hypothetical protein